MDIYIRLASLKDVPALETLIIESAKKLMAPYYTAKQIEGALGNIFTVDSQLIEDRTYFIADSTKQIVGCGGWSRRRTLYGRDLKEVDWLDPDIDFAKIRAFFIHPDWSRQGIGSQLMQQCESAAFNAGFKAIEIVATLVGELFYCQLGYTVTQRFEIPLTNGERLPVVSMYKCI